MRVTSVRGENILSLGKFSLDFNSRGLTLVEGWNYDDSRANGAGKTAIFNAMSLAIYEKLPRKVGTGNVLKRHSKKGFVEVDILIGEDKYTASYGRPKSRFFKKNDELINISQAEWEAIIGLSYDQFLITMYASQKNGIRFLDLNDTAKKDFLLQLMNLSEFAACKREALQSATQAEKDLTELKINIEKARSKIDAYSETIEDRESLQELINTLQDDISSMQQKIKVLENVQQPDVAQYRKLENELHSKSRDYHVLRDRRSQLHLEYRKVTSKIDEHVRNGTQGADADCPHCGQGLKISSDKKVAKSDDMVAVREQHDALIASLQADAAEIKVKIDSADETLKKEGAIKLYIDKVREKISKESEHYIKATEKIKELNVLISMKTSTIAETRNKVQRIEKTEQSIAALKKLLEENTAQAAIKSQEVELYKTVASLYAPTGAPAYITDSLIDSLNESVSDTIELIWPRASYTLESYKENKSGDIVAKFSETLVINGDQVPIGSLSGGEERAFSLALDFAVIDVLNRQFGKDINPIILDEPFEGLDAIGREVVIGLLEKLSSDRQIIVIDHASEAKAMFSHVIRVEKRNGTSVVCS